MKTRFAVTLAIAATLIASTAAVAGPEARSGWSIRMQVAMVCRIRHQPSLTAAAGGAYSLGELQEYCNAPGGYRLDVHYAPGSMRGATIAVGEERVALDGSGVAVVSRAPGPRIRERTIVVMPGQNGFDTDRLNFDIVPE